MAAAGLGAEDGDRDGTGTDQGCGRSSRVDRRCGGAGTLSHRSASPLARRDPAGGSARIDRGGGSGGADLRRSQIADRAARRQHRPRWRRRSARGWEQHRPRPRPDEPHTLDRPGQLHDDRRSWLHTGASTAGGRRGRPAVPAQPRRGGQLPDRRQSVDQCRRHRGIALRQYARADLGARGRAPGRAHLGRAARPIPATT